MTQFCANCGGELASEAAYCEHCGTPLTEAAPPPPSNASSRGWLWVVLGGAALAVAVTVVAVGWFVFLQGPSGPVETSAPTFGEFVDSLPTDWKCSSQTVPADAGLSDAPFGAASCTIDGREYLYTWNRSDENTFWETDAIEDICAIRTDRVIVGEPTSLTTLAPGGLSAANGSLQVAEDSLDAKAERSPACSDTER